MCMNELDQAEFGTEIYTVILVYKCNKFIHITFA